jgi:hypothetical protein
VEDPLSDKLLSGEFVNGDSVLVDVSTEGNVELTRVKEKLPEPTP